MNSQQNMSLFSESTASKTCHYLLHQDHQDVTVFRINSQQNMSLFTESKDSKMCCGAPLQSSTISLAIHMPAALTQIQTRNSVKG